MAGQITLDAVNVILTSSGAYPVNALSTGGTNDAALAEFILDRTNREIQSRGWHVNTELDVSLSPDINGKIAVGSDVLVADSYLFDQHRNVAVRNGILYDLDKNTDIFTGPVKTRLVRLLDYEHLTPTLRDYIAYAAAVAFQRMRSSSRKIDQFILQQMSEAQMRAFQEDAANSDHNILNNTMAHEMLGKNYNILHR